jgi:hypothetical protein
MKLARIRNYDCSEATARARLRLCLIATVLLVPAAQPVWGQSAVWQPAGASTGNIYYNGGNVGIGTTAPGSKLTVDGGQGVWTTPALQVQGTGDMRVRISSSVVTGTLGGYDFWRTSGAFMGGMYVSADTGNVQWYTGSNGSLARVTVQDATGNVGIGTTNPQYTLAVNGNIGAKDIIVTNTGWSDYVFRPGYRLRPLSEVSAFVQASPPAGHSHRSGSEEERRQRGRDAGQAAGQGRRADAAYDPSGRMEQ